MASLAIYAPTGTFEPVRNPFGKDTANLGLFRALARYGGFEELGIFSNERVRLEAVTEALLQGQPSPTRCWADSILRTAAAARAGAVLRGTPNLAELAWLRHEVTDGAYSLLGLIHTLAPPAVREQIASAAIAPFQPWDALICTSPSVQEAARLMFETWNEYLGDRFNKMVEFVPNLPLIPLGVDCDTLGALADRPEIRRKARERLGVGPVDTLVLWLGRLSFFEKAYPQPMFRALEEASALAAMSIHFVMLGWFPDGETGRRRYEAAAHSYAPGVKVHILDGNDSSLVGEMWAACDIFFSLVDNVQETFGLTPVEAMAAGRPIVASDWDGYRSTIRQGIDGFLIPTLGGPPGVGNMMSARHLLGIDSYQTYVGTVAQFTAVDVGRASEALAALIRDPELRLRMGAAGRERTRLTFDWRVVAKQVRQLVDDLAALRVEARKLAGRRSTRRRFSSHPIKGDPFTGFAVFASSTLSLETRVALRPNASVEIAMRELVRTGGIELDQFARKWRASEDECGLIIDALSDCKPHKINHVLSAIRPVRRERTLLAIIWLCKLGILSWMEGD